MNPAYLVLPEIQDRKVIKDCPAQLVLQDQQVFREDKGPLVHLAQKVTLEIHLALE